MQNLLRKAVAQEGLFCQWWWSKCVCVGSVTLFPECWRLTSGVRFSEVVAVKEWNDIYDDKPYEKVVNFEDCLNLHPAGLIWWVTRHRAVCWNTEGVASLLLIPDDETALETLDTRVSDHRRIFVLVRPHSWSDNVKQSSVVILVIRVNHRNAFHIAELWSARDSVFIRLSFGLLRKPNAVYRELIIVH
jgi:hypothetical protein